MKNSETHIFYTGYKMGASESKTYKPKSGAFSVLYGKAFKDGAYLKKVYIAAPRYVMPSTIKIRRKQVPITKVMPNAFLNSTILNLSFAEDTRITEIGSSAFKDSYIQSVELPVTLQSMDPCVLANSTVMKITVPDGCANYVMGPAGIAFQINPHVLIKAPHETRHALLRDPLIKIGFSAFECTLIKKLGFNDSLEIIDTRAFFRCLRLRMIAFHKDSRLRIIRNLAFGECKIRSVTFPDSLNIIGPNAFIKNERLVHVNFGTGLKIIKNGAFRICKRLTCISFPASLTKIGKNAFFDCKSLKTVHFAADGNLAFICEAAFQNCDIEFLKLPPSIKVIEPSAFYQNFNLQIVLFHEDIQLKTLTHWSFSKCDIKKITLPRSIEEIGDGVFVLNKALEVIEVPEDSDLREVHKSAFLWCEQLKIFNVPEHHAKKFQNLKLRVG